MVTSFGTTGIATAGQSGDSIPILFLHGVGSDKSAWRPQLDFFGQQRLAIAIDHPGYGESAFRRAATRDDYARAAVAVLDALDIDRAHICGLSLGGVVAIAIHALAPRRCASLTLADSFAVHPHGEAIHQRAMAASEAMTMRALAEARAPSLLGAAADDSLREAIIETMARIAPEAYRLGAAAVWLADQRQRAAAINVPALVIAGSEDAITPPVLSDELARLIERSRRVTIAGAGHLANLDQPAMFNRAIAQFLVEVEEIVEG